MEQRTQNIINIIKNPQLMNCKLGEEDKAVIRYMSEECVCPIKYYTDDIVLGILREAFADFISTCDYSKYYVSVLMGYLTSDNLTHKPKSLKDAIISTLRIVQVRNNGKYINGFDDKINQLDSKHFMDLFY